MIWFLQDTARPGRLHFEEKTEGLSCPPQSGSKYVMTLYDASYTVI